MNKHSRWKRRQALTGYALAAPVLLGTLIFFALPFGLTFWYSLTFGPGGQTFVGLDNYAYVLSTRSFRLAADNTLRFLGLGVPLILVVSMLLALALQKKFAGTRLFRNVLLFPMVVPVAGIVMVVDVFLAEQGALNAALEAVGLSPVRWMESPAAFWVLMALYVWKNCGYNVILLLAGLNMIPEELYQCARLEGANERQVFWRITAPLMRPTVFFVVVISVINAFKSYREAFLLGGEHPHTSVYFLQHYLNNNFNNMTYSRLSVAAILLFTGMMVLVAVLYRMQSEDGEAVL
ncbi:carbohydrate ABC transporter permease [Fournierella sp.]|uniref:carbohydrate ABC transporter permease n=1 Tax=Allofournierella sp. TaxID=1940256 RepID=UPI0025C5469B|nr:sugar ABC transporter permease [Fournierella sp.]